MEDGTARRIVPDEALNSIYAAIYDASKYLLHHPQMGLAGLG